MLSKEGLWIIELMMRLGTRMHSHPFLYDKKTQIVTIRESLWRWKIMAVILNLYALFAFGRLIESLVFLDQPLHSCVLQVYYLLVNFYFAGLQFNLLVNREDVANITTQFLLFSKLFTMRNPSAASTPDKCGKILLSLVVAGYSHALFHGATFFYLRNNPNFVYSLVVQLFPSLNLIYVQLIFAFLEVTIVWQSWTTSLLTTTMWFNVMENVKIWNHFTSQKFSQTWDETFILYFRSLQLLVGRFNQAYSMTSLCANLSAVLLECTICLYGILVFYGKVPLLVYAVMPISDLIMLGFLYVLFTNAGNVFSSCEDLLNVGRNAFEFTDQPFRDALERNTTMSMELLYKVLKTKMIRSCRPVGVVVGSFFIMKHGTFLTYGQIIVTNTINLLLA